MADVITRLKVETSEYDSKIKRASQGLLQMEEACRKVGGTLAILEKDEKDFVAGLGQMETVSKDARGRINELTKAFTDLSAQYNRLTEEEKKGNFGTALKISLDQLKVRIQDGKKELADINKEINGGGGLTGALDGLAEKFGVNIKQLVSWGAAIGAAKAALGVVKDAFLNTEEGIDEWGRTVKSAESVYDMFLDTLNGGNWSNFFANLSDAIRGARDLYDSLDRLSSIRANNQVAIAMARAEIQQLRVLKQQGQDVDDKIKAATERLATLQKQSVQAGITAGKASIVNTLRDAINAEDGGRGLVNEATLNYVADKIAKGGQGVVDTAKYNLEVLSKKATDTSPVAGSKSLTGATQYYEESFVNLRKLTKEEQQQYIIAKAITSKETEIQEGLGIWANAVNEQAGLAREEFRGNRYALHGSGLGGGEKGSTRAEKPTVDGDQFAGLSTQLDRGVLTAPGLKDVTTKVGVMPDQLKSWKELHQEVEKTLSPLREIESQIKSLKEKMMDAASPEEWQQMNNELNTLQGKMDKFTGKAASFKKQGDEIAESWRAAISMVGTMGSALQNIENPAAKVAGIVAEAIATVALAYSQTLAKDKFSKSNIFAFIAAAAAATASMVTTISTIKKSTSGGFAEGGIVPGNHYSGDMLRTSDYGINSGELILNKAQQNTIAGLLSDNRNVSKSASTIISADQLRIVLRNGAKSRGVTVNEYLAI